jgi:hypothetical protein
MTALVHNLLERTYANTFRAAGLGSAGAATGCAERLADWPFIDQTQPFRAVSPHPEIGRPLIASCRLVGALIGHSELKG